MEVIKRPQNEIVEPSAELPKWIEELLKLFYDFYQTMQINGLLLQSLVWQSKKVKNLKHLSSSFVTFCPRKTPKV